MGLAWDPYAIPFAMAAAADLTLAAVVFGARPWLRQNRQLGLYLLCVGLMMAGVALSLLADTPADGYAWAVTWRALFASASPVLLLFVSTLETPLVGFLRAWPARGALIALAILLSLFALARPELFTQPRTTSVLIAPNYAPPGPQLPTLFLLFGLAQVVSLIAAVSALRRAPRGSPTRARLAWFVAAFAATDALGVVLNTLYGQIRFTSIGIVLYTFEVPAAQLATAGLLAVGIVRTQLFLGRDDATNKTHERRLAMYRAAVESLRSEGAGEDAAILAPLRRSLRISRQQHADIIETIAREGLRHRVERRGRYKIERELGRGGFGQALLAHDTRLDRLVVLKQPLRVADAALRERFVSEARAAARIQHPNVITVYEVLTDEDPPLLVLEYAERGSLHDIIDREGPLQPERAIRVVDDVLCGLESGSTVPTSYMAISNRRTSSWIETASRRLEISGSPHLPARPLVPPAPPTSWSRPSRTAKRPQNEATCTPWVRSCKRRSRDAPTSTRRPPPTSVKRTASSSQGIQTWPPRPRSSPGSWRRRSRASPGIGTRRRGK